MESYNLSKKQIEGFARAGFLALGLEEMLELSPYSLDDGTIMYQVFFNTMYNGKPAKILKVLNLNTIVKVLRLGMESLDLFVLELRPLIKKEGISFLVKSDKRIKNKGMVLKKEYNG